MDRFLLFLCSLFAVSQVAVAITFSTTATFGLCGCSKTTDGELTTVPSLFDDCDLAGTKDIEDGGFPLIPGKETNVDGFSGPRNSYVIGAGAEFAFVGNGIQGVFRQTTLLAETTTGTLSVYEHFIRESDNDPVIIAGQLSSSQVFTFQTTNSATASRNFAAPVDLGATIVYPATFSYGFTGDGEPFACIADSSLPIKCNIAASSASSDHGGGVTTQAHSLIVAADFSSTSTVITARHRQGAGLTANNITALQAVAEFQVFKGNIVPFGITGDLLATEDLNNSLTLTNNLNSSRLPDDTDDIRFEITGGAVTNSGEGTLVFADGDASSFSGDFFFQGVSENSGLKTLIFQAFNLNDPTCRIAATTINVDLQPDLPPVCPESIPNVNVFVGAPNETPGFKVGEDEPFSPEQIGDDGNVFKLKTISGLDGLVKICQECPCIGAGLAQDDESLTISGDGDDVLLDALCFEATGLLLDAVATFDYELILHGESCEGTISLVGISPLQSTEASFQFDEPLDTDGVVENIPFSSLGTNNAPGESESFRIKLETLPEDGQGSLTYNEESVDTTQLYSFGNFSYNMDPHFNGAATFTFKVFSLSGNEETAVTTATLNVEATRDTADATLTMSATPVSVKVGTPEPIDVNFLVDNNDDSFSDFTIQISVDETDGKVLYSVDSSLCSSCGAETSLVSTPSTIRDTPAILNSLLATLEVSASSADLSSDPTLTIVLIDDDNSGAQLARATVTLDVSEDVDTNFFDDPKNLYTVIGGAGGALLLSLCACLWCCRRTAKKGISKLDLIEKEVHDLEEHEKARAPRGKGNKEALVKGGGDSSKDWDKYWDNASGKIYWFNSRTGESSWVPPAEVQA